MAFRGGRFTARSRSWSTRKLSVGSLRSRCSETRCRRSLIRHCERAHRRLERQSPKHLIEIGRAPRHSTFACDLFDPIVEVAGDLSLRPSATHRCELVLLNLPRPFTPAHAMCGCP